jgi:hypothetical protein
MAVNLGAITAEPLTLELFEALLLRPAWHRDAACREHPNLDWVPTRGASLDVQKAVCARCLVQDDCLSSALADASTESVWAHDGQRRRGLRLAAWRYPRRSCRRPSISAITGIWPATGWCVRAGRS